MVQGRSPRRGAESDLIEKVVSINRVAKVVKGGRRFSFSAVVVVGDGQGSVGAAIGRANEVPEAIRKGASAARRNMIKVPLKHGTIPHPLTVKKGAARIMLKPAAPGTGVIAGGGVRAVMEAAGVRDVLSKSLGSQNVINVVYATMSGLEQLRDPVKVRRRRLELAGLLPEEPARALAAAPAAVAAAPAAPEPTAAAPAAAAPAVPAPAAPAPAAMTEPAAPVTESPPVETPPASAPAAE